MDYDLHACMLGFQVPGGYFARKQDSELKYLLSFESPEVWRCGDLELLVDLLVRKPTLSSDPFHCLTFPLCYPFSPSSQVCHAVVPHRPRVRHVCQVARVGPLAMGGRSGTGGPAYISRAQVNGGKGKGNGKPYPALRPPPSYLTYATWGYRSAADPLTLPSPGCTLAG